MEEYRNQYDEELSWQVGPDAISWYRASAEFIGFEKNLGISQNNGFAFGKEEIKFLGGHLTPAEFSALVAEKIKMAELEGM